MSDAWDWLMKYGFGIVLAVVVVLVIITFWYIAFHPEITGGIVSGFLDTINLIAQHLGF